MNAKIKITYRDKDNNIIVNPKEGELGYSPETEKLYIYKDGQWELIKGETNLGLTMYDINKQIISQMGTLEDTAREEAHLLITDTVATSGQTYFMLLCRDINYYTLFKLDKDNSGLCNVASEVFECTEDIGVLKSVESVEGAIEIWVHPTDKDPLAMYLFPYDAGVIECTL